MKVKSISEVTFDDIRQMERDGEFKNKAPYPHESPKKDDYIFDENQTVVWNRGQARAFNEKLRQCKDAYRKGDGDAYRLFQDYLISAIIDDTGISQEKARVVFSKAYDDGHSGGYSDVITHASELCDFVTDILSARPADDADPVVQCKNCKHSHLTMEENSDKLICSVEAWKLVKRDHGCSYGEPRTPPAE